MAAKLSFVGILVRSQSPSSRPAHLANSLTKNTPYKGLGADSEEKHDPVSDVDIAVVDGLKRLTPNRRLVKWTLFSIFHDRYVIFGNGVVMPSPPIVCRIRLGLSELLASSLVLCDP